MLRSFDYLHLLETSRLSLCSYAGTVIFHLDLSYPDVRTRILPSDPTTNLNISTDSNKAKDSIARSRWQLQYHDRRINILKMTNMGYGWSMRYTKWSFCAITL